jgi:hypothetical protein
MGTATVSSTTTSGNQVFVNLTGVTNAQTIQVTLLAVNDGTTTNNVVIPMSILVGDTNADDFVDSADISQTKSQSGTPVTSANFREDVNTDGFIDSADIGLVKSKSGTALSAAAAGSSATPRAPASKAKAFQSRPRSSGR